MCARVISLVWGDHHSLRINAFNELLENNSAVNCTIVAEGHQVKAHQVLLSSFSPLFELLFKEESQEHPIIILTDTSYQDLRALMCYIYQGKLDIPQDQIKSILETAKYLQIRGVGDANKDDSSEKTNEILPLQTFSNFIKLERSDDDTVKPAQNDIIESQTNSDCIQRQTLPVSAVYHVGQLPMHCVSSDETLKESCIQRLFTSPALSTSSSEPNTLPLYMEPVIKVEPQDETFSTESVHEPERQENEEMNLYDSSINNQYQGTREESNICFSTNARVKRENNNEYIRHQECAFRMPNAQSAEISSPISTPSGRTLDVSSVSPQLNNASRDSPGLLMHPAEESEELFHSELDLKPDVLTQEEIVVEPMFPNGGANESSMKQEETLTEDERIAMMRDCSGVWTQRVASSGETSSLQIFASSKVTVQAPITLTATSGAETTGMQPGNATGCLLNHMFSECQKSFRSPSLLRDHMRKNMTLQPLKCAECNYTTAFKSKLNRHRRTHTGERPYKCANCEYAAANNHSLKIHLRSHAGERLYRCANCEYVTGDRYSLKLHMRSHKGEHRYMCPECDYSAVHQCHLKAHLRTHSGERPYKCDKCDHTSSHAGALRRHERTHTGERPFKCSECEYAGARRSDLLKHLHVHFRVKPYKCAECDYTATTGSNLKVHMRTHT